MVKKSKSKFMPKANFLGHLLSFALFFGMNKLLRVPLIWLLLKIQHTRCFLHTRVVLGSQWVWGFEFLANISIFQIKFFFSTKYWYFNTYCTGCSQNCCSFKEKIGNWTGILEHPVAWNWDHSYAIENLSIISIK